MESCTNSSFDVVDGAARRVRIAVSSPADTVADLARAMRIPADFGVLIGGSVVAGHHRLTEVESLVEGAAVSTVTGPSSAGPGGGPEDVAAAADACEMPDLEVAVVSGSACRPWVPLRRGRHGVGRSPAASIQLDDPSAELHHALVDVDEVVRVVQLTGRCPIEVVRADGSPAGPDDLGWFELEPGGAIVIGANRIELRIAGRDHAAIGPRCDLGTTTIGRIAGDPWHREVRRGLVVAAASTDEPIELVAPLDLPPLPAATALVGAGVAALGALTLAMVLGQMMFAVMALIGAVASATTWAVGLVGALRRRRAARRDARAATARFEDSLRERHRVIDEQHRRCHPDVVDAVTDALHARRWIWSRRLAGGALPITIGRGTVLLPATVTAAGSAVGAPSSAEMAAIAQWSQVVGAAVPVSIDAAEAVAIHGTEGQVHGLLRSIVVQSAIAIGPADLRIAVVSERRAGWEWMSWLPHCRDRPAEPLVIGVGDNERMAAVAEAAAERPDRRTLLIVDAPEALTIRTGALRRLVDAPGVSTVVGCVTGSIVPSVCRRVLTIGSTGRAEWTGPSHPGDPAVEHVVVAGLDESVATSAALALAGLVDPEDAAGADQRVPTSVPFSALDPEMFVAGSGAVDERWARADAASLAVPIGLSSDGVIELDLVRDGPHALIAGTTGSGKSELLRTWVLALAARFGPADLQFIFVDYKGGSTFDGCRELPHTAGVVTDLDDGLAERALASLEAELARRERLFRAVGVADLRDYAPAVAATSSGEPLARLVVMIDEFATMAQDVPGFLPALVGIAQRGRSLGVHLVLATQRPAGVVNDDIRANTNLRLALRVNDRTDAVDVLGDELPAKFPRSVPGRCAVRLGHDELIVFQAASTGGARPQGHRRLVARRWPLPTDGAASNGDAGDSQLSFVVQRIADAAASAPSRGDRRIWLEPLPAELSAAEVAAVVALEANADPGGVHDAVGLIDDPAAQARRPLRWDRATGNLLLVGMVGAGVTSTLVALAAAAARTSNPDRRHLYVVDGCGDRSLDALARLAHCGAVIRIGEPERVDRLLTRLAGEVDRRAVAGVGDADPEILFLIDGVGELRRSLDAIDRLDTLAKLDRVLDAGPAVGVVTCCSTDGTAFGAPITVGERWVFSVDEAIAAQHGVRGVAPHRPAGRIRLASTGLDAQVACGADRLADLPDRSCGIGPPPVEVLAPVIDPSVLPASSLVAAPNTSGRGARYLWLGIGADDLEPARLVVPVGDHIFIGGQGRTGRSSVLERVVDAWCSIDGAHSAVTWPWRPDTCSTDPGPSADPSLGGLLLVVDDADRVDDVDGVLAEIVSGRRDVTLAIAARLDAVRSSYGHWTRDVARSRCGVILTAPGDIDGDLLGTTLPRRTSIPVRPGLGWIVDGSGHRLVQFAGRLPP